MKTFLYAALVACFLVLAISFGFKGDAHAAIVMFILGAACGGLGLIDTYNTECN